MALVGKGIRFDTGGHNLKPARYMAGMHEDMNGSAVALALTLAAAELRLPVAIDCWLAIAHNHLSPGAYKQNDIVTALDGTTIEIMHTDAEGRTLSAAFHSPAALAARRSVGVELQRRLGRYRIGPHRLWRGLGIDHVYIMALSRMTART